MKRPLVLVILLLVVALVLWLGFRAPEGEEEIEAPESVFEGPPPTSTSTDATEVFKRAFWTRPTESDRILHAERREWADEDGVDRWQWFIAVEPSTELAHYLNDQNPFCLSEPRGKAAIPDQARPAWFPETAEEFSARQSSDGQMLVLVHAENGRIFATSQGRGFAKAREVTPPAVPSQTNGNPGRLPNSPPPLPEER